FILYSPEGSNVRQKMLFASTKATLKNVFGTGIRFDYFADSYDSLSFDSFSSWLQDKSAKVTAADDDDQTGQEFYFSKPVTTESLLTATEDERRRVKQLEFDMSLARNEK